MFAVSGDGDNLVSVVDGLKTYPAARLRSALERPALVEALIEGDPQGRCAQAARTLDLAKLLSSTARPAR